MLVNGQTTRWSDTFKISYLPEKNEFPSLPLLDLDGIVCGCASGMYASVLLSGMNRACTKLNLFFLSVDRQCSYTLQDTTAYTCSLSAQCMKPYSKRIIVHYLVRKGLIRPHIYYRLPDQSEPGAR